MSDIEKLLFGVVLSLVLLLSVIGGSLMLIIENCERHHNVYQCGIIAVPVEREENE